MLKDWKEDLIRESIGFEIWNGEHEEEEEDETETLSAAERARRQRAAMWDRIRKAEEK